MHRIVVAFAFALVFLIPCAPAAAQDGGHRFQAGAHFAGAVSGEFDSTDAGAGGRASWHPFGLLGAEAEVTFYPSDFPDEPAFSGSRVEALFGATVGPRLGAVRPFVKIRPGVVRYSEAPEPFACILIFPPPLACRLAAGETLFALDVGGGLEFYPTNNTFARIDIGDRLLKYPGPTIDGNGTVRDDAFLGHDFRISGGAGFRF